MLHFSELRGGFVIGDILSHDYYHSITRDLSRVTRTDFIRYSHIRKKIRAFITSQSSEMIW